MSRMSRPTTGINNIQSSSRDRDTTSPLLKLKDTNPNTWQDGVLDLAQSLHSKEYSNDPNKRHISFSAMRFIELDYKSVPYTSAETLVVKDTTVIKLEPASSPTPAASPLQQAKEEEKEQHLLEDENINSAMEAAREVKLKESPSWPSAN